MGEEWDANYKAGRENRNYSRTITPDYVTDAGAYHAGGRATENLNNFARSRPSTTQPPPATGDGSLLLLLLLAPLLAPLLYLLAGTWDSLSAMNVDLWVKIVGVIVVLVLVSYVVTLFFRHLPTFVTASATALYAGIMYGLAILNADMSDTGRGTVVVIAGTIAFFIGRGVSYRERGKPSAFDAVGIAGDFFYVLAGGYLFLAGKTFADSHAWSAAAQFELKWLSATFVVIGVLSLIGRFLWILIGGAVVVGGLLWLKDPQVFDQLMAHFR